MIVQPSGPFTQSLWAAAEELIARIIRHPFNIALGKGTLKAGSFKDYLEQDTLYLKQDTLALQLTAEKAPNEEEKAFFLDLAQQNVEVELGMHEEYSKQYGLNPDAVMNDACKAYGDFLVNTARSEPYEAAISALLPCFWVYQQTGVESAKLSGKGNPFQEWLDTYSDQGFTKTTTSFVELVERVAERSSEPVRELMVDRFLTATQHELEFVGSIRL